MLLARASLLEGLAPRGPAGVIKDAFRAILLDAIALDVSQVQLGGLGAGCREPHDVGFDDDAPSAPRMGPSGASLAAPPARGSAAHQRQDRDAQRRRVAVRGAMTALSEARPENRQFVGIAQSWHRLSRDRSTGY